MLVIVIVLIACGLIAAVHLVIFLCEHLIALLVAVCVAHWAYLSGGGWPGAILAGGLALVLLMAGFRVGLAFIPDATIRVTLAMILSAPALIMAYLISEGLLTHLVPSTVWRIALASVVAMTIAAGAGRRLLSSGTAAAPDQRVVARHTA